MELLSEGLTNAQRAKGLFLSESTVKQHLRQAYKALGVSNRTGAATHRGGHTPRRPHTEAARLTRKSS